jgi:tetratricopeptide (TPR) repeat protein
MKLHQRQFALAAVVFAAFVSGAHADEYTDVAQLTRDGKFVEALARAESHIAAKPRDAQMRFLKGVAQRDAGKVQDAIATFTRLSEDFPELPEPLNNLGVIYADQNQIDKARAAFEAALRTHPSYATAHENLGDIYSKLSSAAYSKALQIEGSSAALSPKLALSRQLVGPGQPKIVLLAAAPAAKPAAIATPAAQTPARDTAASTPAQTKPVAQASPPPPTTNKAAADTASRDAEAFVQSWAAAWSNKDLKAYFGSYGKDFIPSGGLTRNAWESERRARIEGKSKIAVRLDGLQLVVNGSKATAKFRQDYRANGIAISSRKTLELVKQSDGWKIVHEVVGGA